MRSPYDDPELYDRVFDGFTFDRGFYLELARETGGPLLDVGCGTGRLLLRLSRDGFQVDGWEPSAPMFARLRERVRAEGLSPRLYTGGPDAIPTDPRYGLVFCAFNAFAHNLTIDAQLDLLRRMRACLRAGGKVAVAAGHPPFAEWTAAADEPVLEYESEPDGVGRRLRVLDLRSYDPIAQTQHSLVTIEEVAGDGRVVARHESETALRWSFQQEWELLLRLAGFGGWQIHGGYEREARTSDAQPILVVAW